MKKVLFTALALLSIVSISHTQELILTQEALAGDKRPKGKFTAYESKDGETYKIGDELTIGAPTDGQYYTYVKQGDGIITPVEPLTADYMGYKFVIKRFYVSGSKRSGFAVGVKFGFYSTQLENAISFGEIKRYGMTSDEALEALKKAKDKLDLELITQDEYNALRDELKGFIK